MAPVALPWLRWQVVFCVEEEVDREWYERAMRAYLPRDKEEEEGSRREVGEEGANDWGEKVLEERKIR